MGTTKIQRAGPLVGGRPFDVERDALDRKKRQRIFRHDHFPGRPALERESPGQPGQGEPLRLRFLETDEDHDRTLSTVDEPQQVASGEVTLLPMTFELPDLAWSQPDIEAWLKLVDFKSHPTSNGNLPLLSGQNACTACNSPHLPMWRQYPMAKPRYSRC